MSLLSLAAALGLGGLLGLQRLLDGRWAGLRTHMLVSMGTALFVLCGTGFGSETPAAVSRIIQGVAAGLGFIGAGTILKLQDRMQIFGLTTASSLWMAAAVGAACALKLYILAGGGTLLSLLILWLLGRAEKGLKYADGSHDLENPPTKPRSNSHSAARRKS